MKKLLLLLCLAMPVAITPACKTAPSERVTQVTTLKIVGQSAKTVMDGAAKLLAQGQINVAQFEQVARYYDNIFQPAYQLAVEAVKSDLSSLASPDLMNLFGQLAATAASFTQPVTK